MNKNIRKSNKENKNTKEPKDGTFISKHPLSSFSMDGTVRYGEEQDSCDM